MGRGLQIALMLILMGLGVLLMFGPLGGPTSGVIGHRIDLVKPTCAPPRADRGVDNASPSPSREPGISQKEVSRSRETGSETVKKGGPPSFRAPLQIASLMKRKNLEEVIGKYAQKYGVDEDLVWAVIRQESGFNPGAVSPKGAMGLMQLMPGTAAQLGVSDPFDVEQNIAGGVKYLEQCLRQFNQDVPLALAAYNAGPANVVKYQGCPPFSETRNYVASILQAYAGEPIRADLQLVRVSYVIGEDPPASVYPRGLPWRIPLPMWKIVTPQCKLGSPQWKVALRPF